MVAHTVKLAKAIAVLLAISIYVAFLFCSDTVFAGERDIVKIIYFYMNACGTCDPEAEFREMFNETVGSEKDSVKYEFEMYNTFNTYGMEKYSEYIKQNDLSEKEYYPPMVIIGESLFMGENEIKAHIKDAFIKERDKIFQSLPRKKTVINYFYVSPCEACEKVNKLFESMPKSFMIDYNGETVITEIEIIKHNVSEFQSLELANKYFRKYNVPVEEQETPIVFIGDTYLSGEERIQLYLSDVIKSGKGIDDYGINVEPGPKGEDIGLSGYEVLGVFLTGLVNGLNPCSLSMLLFFLSMLMLKKVNLLKTCFSFILGKLVAYFLLGTLFFNIFLYIDQSFFSTFNLVIKTIIIIIVSVIIVINISDFIFAKNEKYDKIRLQLPAGLRKLNHEWIKRFTNVQNLRFLPLISFCLGIIISAGEFLCTGQVYLATIIYVMKNSASFNIQAALYFILYVFALVLPLVIILLVIYKGHELFDVSEFIRSKYHLIKLFNIIVFTVFLLIIIFLF